MQMINITRVEDRAWTGNYILQFNVYVITNPCSNTLAYLSNFFNTLYNINERHLNENETDFRDRTKLQPNCF